MDPYPRGPDWMPITPKTGSLFHAESQPYHSKGGTRTGVFPTYFTDGSYWPVLTVHVASLEVRKGSIAPFGTPSSNDAILCI